MFKAFIKYHVLFFSGRIVISKKHNKQNYLEENNTFNLFLYVLNPKKKKSETHKAKLNIQFQVKRLSLFQRKILPILSTPFYAGFHGFVSKKFLLCESNNTFQGKYEWENKECITKYLSSGALRFMRMISIPGSIKYEIIP